MLRSAQLKNIWFIIITLIIFLSVFEVLAVEEKSDNIPDIFVLFGSKNDKEYAIVVEKSSQKLFLFASDESLHEVLQMNCSTGESHGQKMLSGDKKTPEGVYFFIKEYEDRELAPIYGTKAFNTDYPNFYDRNVGRGGYSIWMHGTNKVLKANDTSGCVALVNQDIDKLSKYISINKTPIIIVDKINYVGKDIANQTKNKILDFILKLNKAIQNGTYHDYLQFYHDDYVPDISWWGQWLKIRKKLDSSNKTISLDFQETYIFKNNNSYVILFDQILKSDNKEYRVGTDRLFLSELSDQYRIVGEEYDSLANAVKNRETVNNKVHNQHPIIVASLNLELQNVSGQYVQNQQAKDLIEEMINGWLSAWSSKDIKRYGTFYADNFLSEGKASLNAWLIYKSQLNQKYSYIKLSKKNFKVEKIGESKSVVSFTQIYESDSYHEVSIKRLELSREGGKWKIYRETGKKT